VKDITLNAYLECLQQLHPPLGLVHVGAGSGIGLANYWRNWDINNVVLIEAEAHRYPNLQQSDLPATWHVLATAIAGTAMEAPWFCASNPAESGLLDLTALNGIWPNLQVTEVINIKPSPLADVLEQLPDSTVGQINWLVIDCLPGLTVLKGTTEHYLGQMDVLLVRVLLSVEPVDEALSEASLAAIAAYLSLQGFRLIAVEAGNHPAVGLAVFSKDWRHYLGVKLADQNARQIMLAQEKNLLENQMAVQLSESQTAAQHLQAQIDQLNGNSQVQNVAKAELESQLSALQGEREQWHVAQHHLQTQVTESQAQIQHLQAQTHALDGQNQEINAARTELESQLAALHDEREQWHVAQHHLQAQVTESQAQIQHLQAQAHGLDGQIQELTAARAELESQLAALHGEREQWHQTQHHLHTQLAEFQAQIQHWEHHTADLNNKLGESALLAEERLQQWQNAEQVSQEKNQRIAELEVEIQSTVTRQNMLQDEMLKAEAQIDLLKDVLLRDTGL